MKAVPARGKTVSGRKEPPGKAGERLLTVRFYRSMKPQRVYPLTVATSHDKAPSAVPVLVRPVVAGAQVVPAEQHLDTRPGSKVTFQVTPLGKGRLGTARVEVRSPGQPVQEIPLRMKAQSQRKTCALLLLTFLVPWFLLHCCTASTAWRQEVPLQKESVAGAERKDQKPPRMPRADDEAQAPPAGVEGRPAEGPGTRPVTATASGGTPNTSGNVPPSEDEMWLGGPDDTLAYNLRSFVDHNVPKIPYVSKWLAAPENRGLPEARATVKDLPWLAGQAYRYLVTLSSENYLPFWVFVALLALTLLSAFTHRARRGKRRARVAVASAAAVPTTDTLPLSTGEPPFQLQPL